VHIQPKRGWLNFDSRELWEHRELLYFLVWRDLKVRYKQTVLGVAWAVLQPLLTMVVFTVIFGYLARLPSDGLPYPAFTLAALLPWQLFVRALSGASGSLVGNQALLTKVYFPRLVIPLSSILAGVIDFGIGLVLLFALMLYYHLPLTPAVLTLPLFVLLALASALAAGLWFSALNVKYRDVQQILPFLMQIWLYATPVAYSSSLVPEGLRPLIGLNPMVGVVEGFRWALFGHTAAGGVAVWISVVMVVVFLIGGVVYFQRVEDTFADVV
jgi:lipopolysaccharide transport system permease protein